MLCRDVYGCTPSQLRAERTSDILRHINMLAIEAEVRALRNKRKKRR